MTKLQAAELTGRHLNHVTSFAATVGSVGPIHPDSKSGVPVLVDGFLREIHHNPNEVCLKVTRDSSDGTRVTFVVAPDEPVTIVEGRIA